MSHEQYPWIFPAVLCTGLIAGLRSFSAPAAVSLALAERYPRAAQLAPALQMLAAGEMLADKLPGMPARTTPPVLAGRALTGAISGAALADAAGRSRITGALLAGTVAIASSYAALALRSMLVQRLAVPDPLVALVEDAVVIVAGRTLATHVAQQLAVVRVERRWGAYELQKEQTHD
jgi:uncharacterized membrane protein